MIAHFSVKDLLRQVNVNKAPGLEGICGFTFKDLVLMLKAAGKVFSVL